MSIKGSEIYGIFNSIKIHYKNFPKYSYPLQGVTKNFGELSYNTTAGKAYYDRLAYSFKDYDDSRAVFERFSANVFFYNPLTFIADVVDNFPTHRARRDAWVKYNTNVPYHFEIEWRKIKEYIAGTNGNENLASFFNHEKIIDGYAGSRTPPVFMLISNETISPTTGLIIDVIRPYILPIKQSRVDVLRERAHRMIAYRAFHNFSKEDLATCRDIILDK